MSKILILANEAATIYHFRLELLTRLLAEGFKVVISVPQSEKNAEFVKLGCLVDEINVSKTGTNPFQELKLLFSYHKQIKRLKPDLVLTYTAKPNIYGSLACQKLKIPYINNVTGFGSMLQDDHLIKKIMLSLQKRAYKNAQCVFFQNTANLKNFADCGIVGSNTALLPGSGVNLEKNKFEPYPKDDKVVRFVTVSRVRRDKGFDELFEAIKSVSEQTNRAEFHLAGWYEDESYKEKINKMSKSYPFFYHGTLSQAQVHALIANSHCLIHPSHHEGMSNVILETAATGRPCLASNIPGCKEAIDDGVTGYLFEAKNSGSLVEAIHKFIDLNYEDKVAMGLDGRKKMEKEFNRKFVVNIYTDEIKKALDHS